MQSSPTSLNAATSTSTPPNPTPQTDVARSNTIISSLAIVLPVVVVCAIVGYRKYRATILRRRIQRLNQLWQLESSQKLS
ncbi:MAG: hypothetical protein HC769_02555 [Cyanobacteria bacterium CRU_2_1]|nr:hypothetical protein [Cyanobacteria bacterium RU_5_0]NJR57828.1 hypothetical protein [Cyanobacteria bacterium CRU_2_1]